MPNTSGKCECGCGETTGVWAVTDNTRGRVKGQHKKFLPGHQQAMGRRLAGERPARAKTERPAPIARAKPPRPARARATEVPRSLRGLKPQYLPVPRLVYAPTHPAAVNGLVYADQL